MSSNNDTYIDIVHLTPSVLRYLIERRRQFLDEGILDKDVDVYYNLVDDKWVLSKGDWIETSKLKPLADRVLSGNYEITSKWVPNPKTGWVRLKDTDHASLRYEKHLPGQHDQHTHNKKVAKDVVHPARPVSALAKPQDNPNYKFSEEDRPVPKEKHKELVQKILDSLGATDVKVNFIYSADDPAYKKVFEEQVQKGEPLPPFVPGKGPLLDFGGGDHSIAYAIYDDKYGEVNVFDDAFSISEMDAAKCLAHEVNHSIFERACKKNKNLYNLTKDENSTTGKVLASSDGVTNYSRHAWNMYLQGKNKGGVKNWTGEVIDMNTAVAETLGEMAKAYVSDRQKFETYHPVWKKLYHEVAKAGGKKQWTLPTKPNK